MYGATRKRGPGSLCRRSGGAMTPLSARPVVLAVAATVGVVVCLVMAGCSGDPSGPAPGPSSRDTVVLAFSGDTTDVQLLGGESGWLIRRRVLGGFAPGTPPRGAFSEMAVVERTLVGALSPDPEIDEEIDDEELIVLRLPSLAVERREWLSDIEDRIGVTVQLLDFEHASRTGERIYLQARRGPENRGVAAIDGRWRWEAFLGGFVGVRRRVRRTGVVEVARPAGPRLVVVGGARSERAARLMIYGFSDLELRDSVFVAAPLNRSFGFIFQGLVPARDGRHVYALTADSLLKVDVRAAEVVARTRRARSNLDGPPMVVTTDPPRIFVGDRGSFDFPGSGELQVYDGDDLSPLETVDVVSSMNDIAVNRKGDRLFVAAGTDFLCGFCQQGSLSVVDGDAMTRIRKFDFERIGPQEVVAF